MRMHSGHWLPSEERSISWSFLWGWNWNVPGSAPGIIMNALSAGFHFIHTGLTLPQLVRVDAYLKLPKSWNKIHFVWTGEGTSSVEIWALKVGFKGPARNCNLPESLMTAGRPHKFRAGFYWTTLFLWWLSRWYWALRIVPSWSQRNSHEGVVTMVCWAWNCLTMELWFPREHIAF